MNDKDCFLEDQVSEMAEDIFKFLLGDYIKCFSFEDASIRSKNLSVLKMALERNLFFIRNYEKLSYYLNDEKKH